MTYYRFEWDSAKARAKEAKHGVSFREAKTVFRDRFAVETFDTIHSIEEDRLIIIGVSEDERLLTVVFTLRGPAVIRIISARQALRGEREAYEKQIGER
jgi:hypothetical protein